MKAYVLANNLSRLSYLDDYLSGREFLLDRFTVADAYLTTVLNWTQVIPSIEMDQYPARWRPISSGNASARASPRRCRRRLSCGERSSHASRPPERQNGGCSQALNLVGRPPSVDERTGSQERSQSIGECSARVRHSQPSLGPILCGRQSKIIGPRRGGEPSLIVTSRSALRRATGRDPRAWDR